VYTGPVPTRVLGNNRNLYATIGTSVQVYNENWSGPYENSRLQFTATPTDFDPTGFYLPPDGYIELFVEKINGTRIPKLLVGTYSRHESRWSPKSFDLKVGKNNITDTFGGMLWIRYGSTTTPDSACRITFGNGTYVTVPVFIRNVTTTAEWISKLASSASPDVLVLGDRIVGQYNKTKAISYQNQDNSHVILRLDQMETAEDVISGLDGSDPLHRITPNRKLITETDLVTNNWWMVATSYRIAVQDKSAANAFQVDPTESAPWGISHEIGHMHQLSPWTWNGLSECTVNIYSLAFGRAFGQKSRLVKDNVYPKAFTWLAITNTSKDFNTKDVWVKLVMFQQLYLAYGDSFYITLHKQTRIDKPVVPTDADKMKYFMLKACTISGNNLTNFFKKWGFQVPQAVYDEITALNLPQPVTHPITLQQF
jgi:hypothetical protein